MVNEKKNLHDSFAKNCFDACDVYTDDIDYTVTCRSVSETTDCT